MEKGLASSLNNPLPKKHVYKYLDVIFLSNIYRYIGFCMGVCKYMLQPPYCLLLPSTIQDFQRVQLSLGKCWPSWGLSSYMREEGLTLGWMGLRWWGQELQK